MTGGESNCAEHCDMVGGLGNPYLMSGKVPPITSQIITAMHPVSDS